MADVRFHRSEVVTTQLGIELSYRKLLCTVQTELDIAERVMSLKP